MVEPDSSFRDQSHPLRLAELVASRICHDLSGPLVALTGGLELMEEGLLPAGEAVAVAADAAQMLALRLRLLRAAWGDDGPAMDAPELLALAAGAPNADRVRFDVSGVDTGRAFDPAAARLVLNVLLLGAESLPGGGRVALAGSPEGDLMVVIEGPRAAWPAGFAASLADEATAWGALTGARAVQAPFTALLARYSGLGLSLLVPAGPSGSGEEPPPLLLKLAREH